MTVTNSPPRGWNGSTALPLHPSKGGNSTAALLARLEREGGYDDRKVARSQTKHGGRNGYWGFCAATTSSPAAAVSRAAPTARPRPHTTRPATGAGGASYLYCSKTRSVMGPLPQPITSDWLLGFSKLPPRPAQPAGRDCKRTNTSGGVTQDQRAGSGRLGDKRKSWYTGHVGSQQGAEVSAAAMDAAAGGTSPTAQRPSLHEALHNGRLMLDISRATSKEPTPRSLVQTEVNAEGYPSFAMSAQLRCRVSRGGYSSRGKRSGAGEATNAQASMAHDSEGSRKGRAQSPPLTSQAAYPVRSKSMSKHRHSFARFPETYEHGWSGPGSLSTSSRPTKQKPSRNGEVPKHLHRQADDVDHASVRNHSSRTHGSTGHDHPAARMPKAPSTGPQSKVQPTHIPSEATPPPPCAEASLVESFRLSSCGSNGTLEAGASAVSLGAAQERQQSRRSGSDLGVPPAGESSQHADMAAAAEHAGPFGSVSGGTVAAKSASHDDSIRSSSSGSMSGSELSSEGSRSELAPEFSPPSAAVKRASQGSSSPQDGVDPAPSREESSDVDIAEDDGSSVDEFFDRAQNRVSGSGSDAVSDDDDDDDF